MKTVKLFHFEACPYCRETMRWLDEVKREHPELASVYVEKVDERLEPEKIKGYDYWYVPTFFMGDVKVHEGAATKRIIEKVLRNALA